MLVIIKGAGDIASGIALRLWRSGIRVVMTDLERPTAIRRTVCFSEAIVHGVTTVEGVTARRADSPGHALAILDMGELPVLIDPDGACIQSLRPDAVVDAILAKRNLGTRITDAPAVVGIGPGFTAQVDCHAVVETMRGHTLGRVYYEGSALPNTNVPGLIGGFAGERVLRAPADGVFRQALDIGALVKAGDVAGYVDGSPMTCTIDGVLRGILADGTPVHKGMKAGDVDPRGEQANCTTASDKALAVGGGVLEAILHLTGALRGDTHEPADEQFVLVRDHIPDIVVDLPYATADNFMGRAVYPFSEAWLRYGTVKRLAAAQEALKSRGFRLKIWDAFRPPAAQFVMWETYPHSGFVADPHKGYSNHSRGNTVDVTLVTPEGHEVVMPTCFDDFSPNANRDYSDIDDPQAVANVLLLETIMEQAGFKPYFGEWWHFADRDIYDVEHTFVPDR